MAEATSIQVQIVSETEGKRTGFLQVPNPTNYSAWGTIQVPFTIIEHGEGPTALLTAGIHGDEYEGQIALRNLSTKLQPNHITGKVIIVPAVNIQGALKCQRLAPADGRDSNRVYPGDSAGSPSQRLAHYISEYFISAADLVVDFHSGGYSLNFLPCGVVHESSDPKANQDRLDVLHAFAAPHSLLLEELDSTGMLDSYVEAQGKLFLTTELGGGGAVTPHTVSIAANGIERVLRYVNILVGDSPAAAKTQLYRLPGDTGYVMSPDSGIFEPFYDLGDKVEQGAQVGAIHIMDNPMRASIPIYSACSGIVFGKRPPALTASGDSLMLIAVPHFK